MTTKHIFYMLVAAASLLLQGCLDKDIFESGNQEDGLKITLTMPGNSTRTSWEEGEDGVKVTWNEGEQIFLFVDRREVYEYKTHIESTGTVALLPAQEGMYITPQEGETVYAIYGAGCIRAQDIHTYNDSISYNNREMIDENVYSKIYDPLYGQGTVKDGALNISMHHFFAFLKLTLPTAEFEDCYHIQITSSENILATYDANLNYKTGGMRNPNSYSLDPSPHKEDCLQQDSIPTIYLPLMPTSNKVTFTLWHCKEHTEKIHENGGKEVGHLLYSFYQFDGAETGFQAGSLYKYDYNAIYQEEHRRDGYESVDFSEDGKVIQLQQATVGKGINLAFMGDGFIDLDMDETYQKAIEREVERLFNVEPYKTFRNRFNVYMVKAVSPSSTWGGSTKHAIDQDVETAEHYFHQTGATGPVQAVVVYNKYAGRSYTIMSNKGSFIAFLMDPDDEKLIAHEAGGHGFARLADEYIEGGNEDLTIPEEEKTDLDNRRAQNGWGMNVDYHNDVNTVLWSKFLKDSRYDNEGLGIFEGANLYGHGVYRPREESIMRVQWLSDSYNAPSREQIYKRIMQESEGDSWTYDYEGFVAYDAVNLNKMNATRSIAPLSLETYQQAVRKYRQSHRPPVFLNSYQKVSNKLNIRVPLK